MKIKSNKKLNAEFEKHAKIFRGVFNEEDHLLEAKNRIMSALPFWIAGLVTAICATLYAQVFRYVEAQSLSMISIFGNWSFIAVPALFVLSFLVIEKFSPDASGSGIPQLMAAAEISQHDPKSPILSRLLGLRIIVGKVISSLLGVLGGGAIGREGPTLQIAGSVFRLTASFLPTRIFSRNLHGMILAGGAAGLASAFNTPLGGIAYVIEELSRSHLSSFRTGILYAVIVAGLVSQLVMGPYLYFGYPKLHDFYLDQALPVVLIAVVIGLFATLFGQSLKLVVIYRAKLNSTLQRAILAGLCGLFFIVFATFASNSINGSGKDLLTELLFDGRIAGPVEVVSRFVGVVVTYAAGGAGGIFAPTLSLGGVAASYLSDLLETGLGPLSILVGMTAALSALTQSPLTSFVLILEMTDRHSAIFPLMISALVGQGISKLISKVSFYEFVCSRILGAQVPPVEKETSL